MSEFFYMGGYAFYVWSSYGLTAIIMIANVIFAYRRLSILKHRLRRRFGFAGVAVTATEVRS